MIRNRPESDVEPNLVLDPTRNSWPKIRMQIHKDIPSGKQVHLCTASFRLFYVTGMDSVRMESADGKDLTANIQIKKDDADSPLRDHMKRSLARWDTESSIPAGSWIEIQLASFKGHLNGSGDIEWDLRVAAIDDEEYEASPCGFPFHDFANPFIIRFTHSSQTGKEVYRRFNEEIYVRSRDRNGVTVSIEKAKPGGDNALDVEDINRANPLPRLSNGQNVFFGDIHWHTAFSTDGQRGLHAALRSARDEFGLDFAGPTDHMLDSGHYGRSTVKDQISICREFDEAGRFVVIPGFELSRRYGHCNVYTDTFEKLERLASRFPGKFENILKANINRYCAEELAALFEDDTTLMVPHHTNMGTEGGAVAPDGRSMWSAFPWPTSPIPNHLRLMEMNQQRGAFEAETSDPVWQPHFWKQFPGGLGGSAQSGLTRGHRIGFLGGTDNHNGWPTLEGNHGEIGGVTGVIADSLDRQSLFDALHARRCYATTGARIVADARLNDHPIGAELQLEPDARRHFTVELKGTAPLDRVEIISFGHVLHQFDVKPNSAEFDGEWMDDRPQRPLENVYYYLRARQTDGQCLWLSPWWVDLPG